MEQRQLEIGDVLERAFRAYKDNWMLLMGVAAVFYVGIGVLAALLTMALGVVGMVVAIGASLIGSLMLTGVYVLAYDDVRDGTLDSSVGEMISRVAPRLGALLVTSLLAVLGIVLGLVLLIVPGLVLMTWWSLATAVVVLEGKGGPGALGRSREIVRGNGWRMFGLIIITAVVVNIVTRLIAALIGDSELGAGLAPVVSGILVGPFQALVPVVAYFDLLGPSAQPAAGATAGEPATPEHAAPYSAEPVPAPADPTPYEMPPAPGTPAAPAAPAQETPPPGAGPGTGDEPPHTRQP